MKEIKLTQNQVALVDDEDFEWLDQWKWCARYDSSGKRFYAYRVVDCKNISMARLIINCPDHLITDHKDLNSLNNQRENLRACTQSQNLQNRNKPCNRNSASQYKGVYWRKDRNRWRADITLRDMFNQRYTKYLGCSKIEEKAALMYDKAAFEEFGEFARLNFP